MPTLQILLMCAGYTEQSINVVHICMFVAYYHHISARNKDQKLVSRFLKTGYFLGF